MPSRSLGGPHWSFALAVYREKGVADACLLLQDQFGIDVSLLLFILFCAVEYGVACDEQCIADLDSGIAPWRSEIVVALRRVRRRLKSGPHPAPSRETALLRNTIKSAELRAEQIQMAALAERLPALVRTGSQQDPALHAIIDRVIANAAERASPAQIGGSDIDAARATIADAAVRVGRRRRKYRK